MSEMDCPLREMERKKKGKKALERQKESNYPLCKRPNCRQYGMVGMLELKGVGLVGRSDWMLTSGYSVSLRGATALLGTRLSPKAPPSDCADNHHQ